MAKTVVMPQMGYDMDAGTLLRWLKQEGDPVERGEAIAEIETDKVNIEIEAFESGVLSKFLITEGQTVPVGEAIAIIGAPGEQIEDNGAGPAAQPSASAPPVQAPQQAAPPAQPPAQAAAQAEQPVQAAQQGAAQEGAQAPLPAPTAPAVPPPGMVMQDQMETQTRAPVPAEQANGSATAAARHAAGERLRASPLVRRLAAEHGIDLSQVLGSGPHGRIVKRDIDGMLTGAQPVPTATPQPAAAAPVTPVEAPAPAPTAEPQPTPQPAARSPQPESGELRELSRIRQTIGKRMTQSWTSAPHFMVSTKIDMGKAMALRKQVNAELDDSSKLSVNDLIVKSVALALRQFPVLNSAYAEGKMQLHASIDVGIAVATDTGLISPFIPHTDQKSLGEIARLSKDLVTRAREGGLKPEEYAGGTFTISNLGMFDVTQFVAVINPPQAAILAIGSIQTEARWNADAEQFEPAQLMEVTMSADHRLTDGAEVARYLQELKRLLQAPMSLLVG